MSLSNEQGQSVPVKLIDNHDRTYRVEFEPTSVGQYSAVVTFAGQRTPSSPYRIDVQPAVLAPTDVSKVRVTDLPQGPQLHSL